MASAPEAPTAAVPVEAVEPAAASTGGQKVDPWNVSGEVGEDGKVKAIDYKVCNNAGGSLSIGLCVLSVASPGEFINRLLSAMLEASELTSGHATENRGRVRHETD